MGSLSWVDGEDDSQNNWPFGLLNVGGLWNTVLKMYN